jgi:cytochrome c2
MPIFPHFNRGNEVLMMQKRYYLILIFVLALPMNAALAADEEAGKEIFDKVCAYCHGVDGKGNIGPSLIGIGERRDEAWLHLWLKDPREMIRTNADAKVVRGNNKYDMTMPPIPAMKDDAKRADVIAYLLKAF